MARIAINAEMCKGCKLCLDACPARLIQPGKNLNAKGYFYVEQHDSEKCTACKLCAIMCPDAAISVYK